ncbi:MAG: alpha-amylase family glycosyl hydrolase [Chthoniobacteraceae bacterium]
MTAAFFSPEGAYASNINDASRISELKLLVAALHAKGIGVILDVVFNHTTNDAPFFKIAPDYYYRHWSIGGFSNGSGCGNDFRTEAPMARRLVIDSLKYWMTEFGVDGFRFDLMGLLDADTMREAEYVLRQINSSVLLYGEPWSANHSPMPPPANKDGIRGTGIAAFNDDYRNGLKGSPDGDHPGFIQRGWNSDSVRAGLGAYGWPEGPWQTINYMTCHDNLVLFDKLKISLPGATEESSLAAMKIGYLLLYTSQGVPFLHGGEEFARSKGGHHNSYNAPDVVNQVDWSLKAKHHDLFLYVRDLIALRKSHPIFRLRSREDVNRCLRIVETGNWRTLQYVLDATHLNPERWSRLSAWW